MTDQLSLYYQPDPELDPLPAPARKIAGAPIDHDAQEEAGDPIEEAFQLFHQANPHVYEMLASMARRVRLAGFKRYGIKTLFEAARYRNDIETNSASFKLNNNFTALYARMIMAEQPDLEGMFELRRRKGEDNG